MVRETQSGTERQGYHSDIAADRAAILSRASPKDTDKNGLADRWEQDHRLDPLDSSELSQSGYSFLEQYCREFAIGLIDDN